MSSDAQKWVQTAANFARVGELSVRIGILVAVVYGIFWAIKLFFEYIHGLQFLSRPFVEYMAFSAVSFAVAALTSYANERYSEKGNFRMAGLTALVAASVLLIPATVAGVLLLLGGLALYISAEIVNVSKIEFKKA